MYSNPDVDDRARNEAVRKGITDHDDQERKASHRYPLRLAVGLAVRAGLRAE